MKKEKVFETLRSILDQSGMDEIIKISTQQYETADFCIIEDAFLGFGNIRTVQFSCIERISYTAEEDNPYCRYTEGYLQIVFKIKGGVKLIYENGEMGDHYWIVTPDLHIIEALTEVEDFLKEYNAEYEYHHELTATLQSIPFFDDSERDLALQMAIAYKQEALTYIDTHPDCVYRDEVLFELLCSALYVHIIKKENSKCDDFDDLIKLLPVEELVPLLGKKTKMVEFFKYERTSSAIAQFEDICAEAELLVIGIMQKMIG